MAIFKKLAVILTVAAIAVTSLGAFFLIKAENANVSNGIKLSFGSSCGNGEEGNFWLGDFGRSIFFTDSEKKHASVTFTNSSDTDVKVTLRGVSSNWADQRFAETKIIPAKGNVTVETYDVKNLTDTDVIYFYLKGITPNSEITFRVNYTDVDYSSLTAASMQGNGKFTVSEIKKESVKLSLVKMQGVKYTVALEDSVFAFVRDADNFERTFEKGDKVKVYLTLDESVKDAYKGINVNGNVSEGTSIPLTIEADTTVGAEFEKSAKMSKGLTFKFNSDCNMNDGNFYFNQADIKNLIFSDNIISFTVFNESDEAFSAGAFVVNGQWERISESRIEEILPGQYKTFDLENIKLENKGELFYMYLKNIKPVTKLRVLFNGVNVDYSVFTAPVLSGLDVPPFEVATGFDDTYTVKAKKSDGVKYCIFINGSKIATLNNSDEGKVVTVKGNDIKIVTLTENGFAVSAWEINGTKVSGNGEYEIKAIDADVTLKAFAQKGSSVKEDTGDSVILSLGVIIAIAVGAVVILSRRKVGEFL